MTGLRVAPLLLALVICANFNHLLADDTAVEVAAGGIRPSKDVRISMEKERLTIGVKIITVDYEFLNTSDADIVTEVGFPIPPYEWSVGGARWYGAWSFTNFKLWVDGEPVHYQTEARAKVKAMDYTELLNGLDIDVQTFDHNDPLNVDHGWPKDVPSQHVIGRLPQTTRDKMRQLGLLDSEGMPSWTVFRNYYWSLRFPAHRIIKVRHEYTPVIGFAPYSPQDFPLFVKDACVEPKLQRTLTNLWTANPQKNWVIGAEWVKFILNTANYWKTPIKDFDLIIEIPPRDKGSDYFFSLCWDGKVRRIDKSHFEAEGENFVPRRDLAVYYFQVGQPGEW